MVGCCERDRGGRKLIDSLDSRTILRRFGVSNANHIMLENVYFISFTPCFK